MPQINPRSSDSTDSVHDGYTLEEGLLSRLREWVDLLPWLRLGRVLRIAGSPPLLSLTSISMIVWLVPLSWFSLPQLSTHSNQSVSQQPMVPSEGTDRTIPFVDPANPSSLASISRVNTHFPQSMIESFTQLSLSMSPWNLLTSNQGWGKGFIELVWTLFVWTPTTLILIRQGSLLCAGRDLMSFNAVAMHAMTRTPIAWFSVFVPVACALTLGSPLLLAGWIETWVVAGWWAEMAGWFGAILAIPAGLLLFGSFIAVPLAFAAIVNEPEADALDSLSRGYESFLRRPMQLVGYGLICLICVLVIGGLATAVMFASGDLVRIFAGPESQVTSSARRVLAYFPGVVVMTLSYGFIGGTYLLMRRHTGGQEVEDLWEPPKDSLGELPVLPTSD